MTIRLSESALASLTRTLTQFDAEAARASDPRHAEMIRSYQEHVRCETTGDVDGILRLFADDAELVVHGTTDQHYVGTSAIRRHYDLLTSGNTAADTEIDLRHLIVGDWGIVGILAGTTNVEVHGRLERRTMELAFLRFHEGERCSRHVYFAGAASVTQCPDPEPKEVAS